MRRSRPYAALAIAGALAGCAGPGPSRGWPREYGAGVNRASAALDAGRREEAAAEVALLTVPEEPLPEARVGMLLKRAQLKDALGDFSGEESDLRAALSLRPGDFDALCRLTQFLRDRSRLDESLEAAQRLAAVTEGISPPNRAEKWLQRAETLMRLGRRDEAAADVARALAEKPEDHASLWLMVQILLRSGRPADALPFADRMVAASRGKREKAQAYGQRAQIRDALGDRAGADRDADSAVRSDPRDFVALESRMERAAAAGKLDDALALADRAVAAGASAPGPQRATLLEQRAQVKRRRGDAAGAEVDLRAALDVQPDAPSALRTLAELQLESGKAAEAARTADRLLEVSSRSSASQRDEARRLRARALEAAGRTAP